jgi:hypothetical protein
MEAVRRLAATIYIEAFGDRAVPILPAGSALPAMRRHRFHAARDDQMDLEIHLLFGASTKASANVSVARWQISGIAPLMAGQPDIWVQIGVDADGWVSVAAADRGEPLRVSLRTKAVVMAPVDTAGTLSDSLAVVRQCVNAGDRDGAKRRLADLLQSDPQNLSAWALLAVVLDDPAKHGDCYRHILRRDPGNRYATTMLEALVRSGGLALGAPLPDVAEVRETLGKSDRQDLDEETLQEICDRGVVVLARREALVSTLVLTKEEKICLAMPMQQPEPDVPDELLELLQIQMPSDRPAAPSRLVMPSPEEIIQMAGGPLPPEERHECPACGAVVARTEDRCSWCDAPLSDGGGA